MLISPTGHILATNINKQSASSFKHPKNVLMSNPVAASQTPFTIPLLAHKNMLSYTINFGRSEEKHRRWLDKINPETKEATLKLFTFRKIKDVWVEIVDPAVFGDIKAKEKAHNEKIKMSDLNPEDIREGRRLLDAMEWFEKMLSEDNQNPPQGDERERAIKELAAAKEAFQELIKPYDPDTSEYGVGERLEKKVGKGGPISHVPGSIMRKLNPAEDPGVFEINLPSEIAKDGYMYRFLLVDYDNNVKGVKDPMSNRQTSVFSWSSLHDQSKFNWTDDFWRNFKNPDRISRLAHEKIDKGNVVTKPRAMNLYELHIGSLTEKGDFEAAIEKLDNIKKMGFNAIHVMPVEGSYSHGWTYDSVDKYGISETYGGPEKFKKLVDEAHKRGLNVVADIVLNHYGQYGNMLPDTAPYRRKGKRTEWGDPFNYEGKSSVQVRDFAVNLGLYYLKHFGVDGLRYDMTKNVDSDYTLKQITAEVHHHHPDAFLIAEDGRERDPRAERITKQLDPDIECRNDQKKHIEAIKKIDDDILHKDERRWTLDALGFDLQWGFEFHHSLAACILDDWHFGEYKSDPKKLLDEAEKCRDKLKYIMSHDEIGNNDGTKLIHKSIAQQMRLSDRIKSDCDGDDNARKAQRGQRAAQASYEFAKIIATGEIDKMSTEEFDKFVKSLHIEGGVSREIELLPVFKSAIEKHKAALGFVYTTPGPVMLFQGDECANLDVFRFFRITPNKLEDAAVLSRKGYEPGEAAVMASKMGNIKPSKEMSEKMKLITDYTVELNKLAKENPALVDGYIHRNTCVDNNDCVFGVHSVNGDDEIYAVSALRRFNRPEDISGHKDSYGMLFPDGEWEMIINSDEKRFGGSGEYVSETKIINTSDPNVEREKGRAKPRISIPPNGTVIYRKIKTAAKKGPKAA